jgi:diguanylate cyclase (GGDEF)-like protein/PAS domain S-box-containing protein
LGYTREEALGRDMAELLIPDGLRADYRRALARHFETGTSEVIGRRLEVTATRADGSEFPAELSIAKVRATGRPLFTGFLRDITDRKRMVRQLAFRASHDALTKSLNRTAFMGRLRAAGRDGPAPGRIAVLFVDLDHFKAINDSLGHLAGDQLLIAAARRLRKCVRPGDAVARLGGDEFAMLLESVSDEEAAIVADRVRRALAAPFDLDGRTVLLTASIGLALSPDGESRVDDLLREADEAMYREKATGHSGRSGSR